MTSKKRGCGNICPQFKKDKRRGKDKESCLYIVFIKLTGGGLLVLKN